MKNWFYDTLKKPVISDRLSGPTEQDSCEKLCQKPGYQDVKSFGHKKMTESYELLTLLHDKTFLQIRDFNSAEIITNIVSSYRFRFVPDLAATDFFFFLTSTKKNWNMIKYSKLISLVHIFKVSSKHEKTFSMSAFISS